MRTPEQVREYARTHEMATTAGHARGFMQANLLAVPQEYAFDFLLFAQRNPKPCPIVGVLEAGQYTSELLPGGDIRTDIPAYRVFENGEHSATLGSPTLNEQMDNLLARMRLTFLLAIPRYPQLHADHIQGNITLATLIADGKRDEAATLAHDSLMNTCDKILAVLED